MNRQIGFDLPQNSSALSFVHPHRLSSWSLKRNCFRLQSSVYSSLRQENRVHRYISTGSRPGLCPICCSSVGTSAPTTEQPDRKAWPVSAAKAAVCLLAAYAWCRYSALSPGSLFCSASLAASTTQSGECNMPPSWLLSKSNPQPEGFRRFKKVPGYCPDSLLHIPDSPLCVQASGPQAVVHGQAWQLVACIPYQGLTTWQ